MKETIYIGIDIAKYKHDFCIISSTGEVIVQNNSFENNKKGFFKHAKKPVNTDFLNKHTISLRIVEHDVLSLNLAFYVLSYENHE